MNFISETTPPIVIASKLNSYIPEIPPDIASISPNISKELVKRPTILANIIPLPSKANTFTPHKAPTNTKRYGKTFINS